MEGDPELTGFADRMRTGAWRTAVLWTTGAGVLGLVVVGWLFLHPPDIARSTFKAWDYLDKRWVVALYLLCVALVYLPGVFARILERQQSPSEVPALPHEDVVAGAIPCARTWRSNSIARAVLAVVVGCTLAVLYVVPLIPGTVARRLDTHELVHLGSLQRIAQGARPYVDARTQYGPGHQFVSYALMRKTEFTVRGFRVAHMLTNLVVVALFFSIVLFAFGWTIGAAVVGAALFVSPLQVTSFVGWGVLVRWFGPFLVGTWAPAMLWAPSTETRQRTTFALMGATCGVLAWFAQENGPTSILALVLVLGAAVIRRGLSIRSAITLAVIFIAFQLALLTGLLAWVVGLPHLGEAFALYRRSSALVTDGMTNTAWTMVGTAWSNPNPTWVLAFYLTPCVIVGLAVLALYVVKPAPTGQGDIRIGQLLGMLAAAAALDSLTLLRSDATHVVGSSMAIAPLVVLSVAYLPGRLFADGPRRLRARIALSVTFLVIYPFLWAAPEYKMPPVIHLVDLYRGMNVLNEVRHGQPPDRTATADIVAARLGFDLPPGDRCCNINTATNGDWSRAFQEIRSAVGGRSVYVDTRRNYSAFGAVASAVYFIGDLKVGTAFVEPMMSVWVDEDVAAAKDDLRTNMPDCLITGGQDYLMTPFVLGLYGRYSEARTSGPVSATVYCRQPL